MFGPNCIYTKAAPALSDCCGAVNARCKSNLNYDFTVATCHVIMACIQVQKSCCLADILDQNI